MCIVLIVLSIVCLNYIKISLFSILKLPALTSLLRIGMSRYDEFENLIKELESFPTLSQKYTW